MKVLDDLKQEVIRWDQEALRTVGNDREHFQKLWNFWMGFNFATAPVWWWANLNPLCWPTIGLNIGGLLYLSSLLDRTHRVKVTLSQESIDKVKAALAKAQAKYQEEVRS
ncbi:hypothetical protein KKG24_04350 [Patescibacteria group bacterium]|nr:hypothetical protein [Patescibacteria group bacterium]